jgi:hypothetical protein
MRASAFSAGLRPTHHRAGWAGRGDLALGRRGGRRQPRLRRLLFRDSRGPYSRGARPVSNRNVEALAVAWAGFEQHATNPRKLAQLIARHAVAQMIEDRQMGIMIIEFHLAATCNPELAQTFREWGRAYARISRDTFVRLGAANPVAESALLTNLMNGLILKQLALRRSDFESELLRPAIERFLLSIGTDERGSRS